MLDPYGTLGVSKTASQEEIKAAYRKLAKSLHPDLNPGNKAAEKKFKDVAAAYDLIGDEEKRKRYDQGKLQEEEAQARARDAGARHYYYETQNPNFGEGGYSRGFSFEDLFGEDFLRGARGRSRRSRGPEPAHEPTQGNDELYRMEIELRDAIQGAEREITLPSGKKLRIKIPAGVTDGSRLRFAGQGGPGIQGGPPGDAYIELNLRPSPLFKRESPESNNLEMELPVSLSEALNGGSIRVPTPDGFVLLNVPAGVSSGARIRIRGKGLPEKGHPEKRGDLFARVKIVLPTVTSDELKKAAAEDERKHPFDPRRDFPKAA